MLGGMGLHVIQFPSKRFGFVGTVPVTLATLVPATTAGVMGQRAFNDETGRLVEPCFPTFDTREEAVYFAALAGETVCPRSI